MYSLFYFSRHFSQSNLTFFKLLFLRSIHLCKAGDNMIRNLTSKPVYIALII
jgi:hypothetical protein